MNIYKMHETFRTLGQRMGIQNVRGILPESIDVMLNLSIDTIVRANVMSNTQVAFDDRVSIQDNSISPINLLRNFYKTKLISVNPGLNQGEYYISDLGSQMENEVMYYTSFSVLYNNSFNKAFGARLIEGDKIHDTLRDYCNAPSHDYPIVTLKADDNGVEYLQIYKGIGSIIPTNINVNYIKKARAVKWDIDINNSISSDLPEYIHSEVVTNAVTIFFHSLNLTTPQQQE